MFTLTSFFSPERRSTRPRSGGGRIDGIDRIDRDKRLSLSLPAACAPASCNL
ncbi:MAG: hypothetical protein LBK99_22445 [Opitutaceae bacterium]|nr:hypothetical protein [Opitutaceae bacterium]